jgi:tetrahydromethanopterin S-methyltransferase subunit B
MAYQMAERNRRNAEELDRVFMMRKQRENDIMQIEEQIEKYHKAVEDRIRSLDRDKQRAYEELSNRSVLLRIIPIISND